MGGSLTKSPLQRRNTVARRSQRRSINGIKSRVDGIMKGVRRFKGVDEDEDYNDIKAQLDRVKKELSRKLPSLQPQVRSIYNNTQQFIEEVEAALEKKLKENREKPVKKPEETKSSKEDIDDQVDWHDSVVIEEVTDPDDIDSKRQTVELKLVQFLPNETTAQVHEGRTQIQKHNSILKVGVAVMPGAIMEEVATHSSRISQHYQERASLSSPINVESKINDTIEQLQHIEYNISTFVGRKHGAQYEKIRADLNMYLIDMNQINTNDEALVEQLKTCKNYIGSCLNFLDEQANDDDDDSEDEKDDVFGTMPSTTSNQDDVHTRLQKLTKTTAI